MKDPVLAVDIGGSKIIVGIVDGSGRVLYHCKQELPASYDINLIIETICQLAEPMQQYHPAAAGVTIPGLADPKTGMWKYAPFSAIADIPIADLLNQRLGLPVFIENDVNACAVGEKTFGVCQKDDDFLWVTVSNGIGAALYLNGNLYSGKDGNAGELGHIIVEEDTDAVCGCGKKGCLEAMASGRGIENMYYTLYGRQLSAQQIALAADSGEEEAIHVYEMAGHYIGKAVAGGINLLNLKKIVFGGGVTQSFHLLKKAMEESLRQYVFTQANKDYVIEKTGLGYHAALIGAAAVAQKNLQ